MGNAYYRLDNITQAVLAYERALMLSPGDKDIRFNLQFARSKTIDKITPESEMFFVTWYHALVSYTSVNNWAMVAIVSIIVSLFCSLCCSSLVQRCLCANLDSMVRYASSSFSYSVISLLINRNNNWKTEQVLLSLQRL